ncbi:hypothetical protein DdX_17010 [Ditylenchus destructor]|uniref:Uncharacterized protein n=1 Tax=Ditylenchus destructor TaxID=166010 RepID=A0AAD4QZC8_9BILA|nr:hypothetical protein DdX_17010 [Ditylenchus destructor]
MFGISSGNSPLILRLNYSATSVINRDNSAPPSLGEFVTRALEVLKNNESIKNTGTVLGENRWKLWDKLNVQDHFYSMEVWDERYSDYVYASFYPCATQQPASSFVLLLRLCFSQPAVCTL